MLAQQVANGTTELRIRTMWDEPQPFFDEYCGGRVGADEADLDDRYEPEFVSTALCRKIHGSFRKGPYSSRAARTK